MTEPKPLNYGAERSLLGGLIIEPSWLAEFANDLTGSDFYRPEHGALFDLLVTMVQEPVGIDLVTLVHRVGILGDQRFGGAGYVADLPDHCPSTANLRTYARIVRENARVRRLRGIAALLLQAADGHGPFGEMPAGEIADEWIPRLAELAVVRGARKHSGSLLESWREAEDERLDREAGSLAPELTVGFPKLDELVKFRGGDLVVIGGEASMGKSALAQAFSMEITRYGPGKVSYHSLEMPRKRIALRFLAYALGIPTAKLKERGELSAEEDRDVRVVESLMEDGRFGVEINDRPRLTIGQIAIESRALWSRGGLKAVVIDHLHLMKHGSRGESRAIAIGETTSQAKELAMELGVPVFLLSQLSRTAARRADPRTSKAERTRAAWWETIALPELSDLRDSGAIEQDADIVLFPIHASRCGLPNDPTSGAVVVAKQRDGALGTVGVRWDGPCASYRPYAQPLLDGGYR